MTLLCSHIFRGSFYPQGRYTEPLTGLRYHDKSVYDVVKSMVRQSLFNAFV